MSVPTIETETPPQPADETPAGGKLLLDSLEITNFRAFRHLVIPTLGRINLITGKNSVGKTCLLEALIMYARLGSPEAFWEILKNRQQLGESDDISAAMSYGNGKVIEGVYSIFHKTNISEAIRSRRNEKLTIGKHFARRPLSVSVSWLAKDSSESNGNGFSLNHTLNELDAQFAVTTDFAEHPTNSNIGKTAIYDLRRIIQGVYRTSFEQEAAISYSHIPSTGVSTKAVIELFDMLAVTPRQDEPLQFAQLVNPAIELIGVRSSMYQNSERLPFVLLSKESEPVPLSLLGDGIQRLYGLALAIANAPHGFLLVDEFENGLHYTIQREVWRYVFRFARKNNIQVFATTHSWDCIEAFQQAASEDEDPNSGVLVRLTRQRDNIVSTVISEEDLAGLTRNGIEVR